MKRFVLLITALLLCGIAAAHTINWRVDGNIYQTTTCDSGESITPPTAPTKYGYHFKEWISATPIEYLESTGGQWIDTGFIPDNNTGIEIKIQNLAGNSENYFFGAGQSAFVRSFESYIWGSTLQFTYSSVTANALPDNTPFILNWRKNVLHYIQNNNDVLINLPTSSFVSPYSMYLFAIHRASYSTGRSRIYYCKLYDNHVLVRDFIPVLDKDGVPCMYDKVEGKFYYNAGTGQFIAGPVLQ